MIGKPRIPLLSIITIGFLPGFLKKIIYRIKGAKIGQNVKIGMGSVIIGQNITIGNNVKIGFLTLIRGKNIRIGDDVFIGGMTFLDCPYLHLDDSSRITEQVIIGGPETHDSKFVLGKNSMVMTKTVINPVKPVIIGDDSGIGGDCLVFSHSSWLNVLEGYPIQYESVTIGNSVWIGWRVFVMPGTAIGDGSVIGANSLVKGIIPEKSLAVGSPAKIIANPPDFPKEFTKEQKKEIFSEILKKMISHFNFYSIDVHKKDNFFEFTYITNQFFKTKKKLIMHVQTEDLSAFKLSDIDISFQLLLSLDTIPDQLRRTLYSKKISWIDVNKKQRSFKLNELGLEVADYLRNYGIRLLSNKNNQKL